MSHGLPTNNPFRKNRGASRASTKRPPTSLPGRKWEQRFRRQLQLSEIGHDGQLRLRDSSVVMVGCGGLGGIIASLLIRGGVGTLRLIDRDVVELDNLHRQLLYTEVDVQNRTPKVEAAARILSQADSGAGIEASFLEVDSTNIEELIADVDLLVDATDNLKARYLINDVCVKTGTPWVYGGIAGTMGMMMPMIPGKGPCFRCLFPESPAPASQEGSEGWGILNTVPAVVGSLQASVALKLLVGDEIETGRLTYVDPWRREFHNIIIPADPDCRTCVHGIFEFLHSSDES